LTIKGCSYPLAEIKFKRANFLWRSSDAFDDYFALDDCFEGKISHSGRLHLVARRGAVRNSRLFAVGIGLALITVSLLGQPVFAQQPATGSASSTTTSSLGHPCNLLHDLVPTSDTDPTPVNPPKLTRCSPRSLFPEKTIRRRPQDQRQDSGLRSAVPGNREWQRR